jgi:hypothetical protein
MGASITIRLKIFNWCYEVHNFLVVANPSQKYSLNIFLVYHSISDVPTFHLPSQGGVSRKEKRGDRIV